MTQLELQEKRLEILANARALTEVLAELRAHGDRRGGDAVLYAIGELVALAQASDEVLVERFDEPLEPLHVRRSA